MYVFVVTLHVILSLLLVVIILMQPGKGADLSSAFGGGAASQLFGASGPGNFLTRGTGAIAGLFMVTSITLSLYSTEEAQGGVNAGDVAEDLADEEEGAGFGVGGTSTAPAPGTPAAPPAPATPAAPPAGGAEATPSETPTGTTPAP